MSDMDLPQCSVVDDWDECRSTFPVRDMARCNYTKEKKSLTSKNVQTLFIGRWIQFNAFIQNTFLINDNLINI